MRNTRTGYWVILLNPVLLAVWVLGLRKLYQLCQYGDLKGHVPMILACGTLGILWLALWTLVYFRGKRKRKGREAALAGRKSVRILTAVLLAAECLAFAGGAAYYGVKIAKAAVPYNGALSWKLEQWRSTRKITLEHDNVFESGLKGVFEDLEKKVDLPEDLYLINEFSLSFNGEGKITQIYGFFGGKAQDGEEHTYLVDYSENDGDQMTLWLDNESSKEYTEADWMNPMLELMDVVDLRSQLGEAAGEEEASFLLTYSGYTMIPSPDQAVVYQQDGSVSALGERNRTEGYVVRIQTQIAGAVLAEQDLVNGWRTADTTQEEEKIQQEQDEQKQVGVCYMDRTDESWYFYLDNENGWRLRVHDAALGSRWYVLDRTNDGGQNWETVNENPFQSQMGVAQGIQFLSDQYGYLSIGGASGSWSQIFVTRDGGVTSAQLQLPWDQVTGASKSADQYPYLSMPEENGDGLEIRASADSSGQGENLVFVSADQGESWQFTGVREE